MRVPFSGRYMHILLNNYLCHYRKHSEGYLPFENEVYKGSKTLISYLYIKFIPYIFVYSSPTEMNHL